MRFISIYGVFPRGWSKTYNEYLAMLLAGVFFPGIDLAMTAQTKENANKDDLFIMDIIRQEVKNDDPRIQRNILK